MTGKWWPTIWWMHYNSYFLFSQNKEMVLKTFRYCIIFMNGGNGCYLLKTTGVIICLQIGVFVLLIQIFFTHSLWKCLLLGETDWRLRHQFQKASLMPTSSARPHQNVNLILHLDSLLFLLLEWGTQQWTSTESASLEIDQLIIYFSSVTRLK